MGENREFVRCDKCGATNETSSSYCYRCGLKLKNESSSVYKSFIFLISAIFFYIPANIYPILQTNKFYVSYENSIIGGIFTLWREGDYPIAVIVFLASVLIPILKFVILFYLLLSIKSKRFISFKKKLYKFIEISGPWSLLDVFVVFIMGALVRFDYVSALPQEASIYFLVMVIFTILASKSFDERLISE